MPGSAAIGNLAVNLSMETAAFTSGATQAQSELRNLSGAAQSMGRGFGSLGMSANSARIVTLELTHVTRALGEQLAMGVSPARAFASEIGRISTAVQYAGGIGGLGRMIAGLVAPFAGAAAGAGLLAAAFLGVKQAASSADLKAYIDTLGLTDEQIKKLKDTTVTWGDVTKATFQVLAESAGTSAEGITSAFSSAFKWVGEFGKFSVSVLLAGFAALVRGLGNVFINLGAVVANGIAGAVNVAIGGLEKLLNSAIHGLNTVGGLIAGVFHTQFASINDIKFDRMSANFKGATVSMGQQFHQTFDGIESGFDKIAARAVQLRKNSIAAQAAELRAGDAAGKSAGGHEKAARAIKHETDELEKFRGKLEQVSNDLANQGPIFGGQSAESVGTAVNSAIGAFNDQMAEEAKHQQQLLSFADQFGGAIAAVATGTESLKQAFGDMAKSIISDIIRMTVRMLVFKAISGIFGGSDGADTGSFGSFEETSGGGGFNVPGFASGGSGVFGGFGGVDRNVLSLNGSPIARVSRGEHFNVSNDNPARNVKIEQHYSFSGVAVTKDEFVSGLMFAKHDTIATIKDMNRRGRR